MVAKQLRMICLVASVAVAIGCEVQNSPNHAAVNNRGNNNSTGLPGFSNEKFLPVRDGKAALVPLSDGLAPREVVQAAYAAANTRQYALADKFLCTTARRISTSPELQKYWDRWTREGTVDRLKVEGENIRGTQAQVRLVIEYADGSESDEISENLIREADGWRMDYPGDDATEVVDAPSRPLTR